MRSVSVLGMLLVFFSGQSSGQELTFEEAEVWRLEEAYYEYASNNDPDGYLSLFHEDVLGWPTFDRAPKGKDRVSQWIADVHADPEKDWKYEIERLATQSHGNVVVVQYRLEEWFETSESDKRIDRNQFRISHTWLLNAEGQWQIIAGMGGFFNVVGAHAN